MYIFGWFALILAAVSINKTNKIESQMKKIKRGCKREKNMSKILSELKNKKCKLVSDELLEMKLNREYGCTILDVDDEWLKINLIDKKGINKTYILRIENIERVELDEV
ncbi:hypothetical protein GMB70_15220 [Turicibacter sanguinis]|nr:hypothetical protein [Turicibacter sanguinis]